MNSISNESHANRQSDILSKAERLLRGTDTYVTKSKALANEAMEVKLIQRKVSGTSCLF